MSDVCHHTNLKCLVVVARKHGLDLSVDQLVHDYALENEPDTGELRKIAEEAGLKAKLLSVDWKGLGRLGDALPVIARLKNGHSVILIQTETHEEQDFAFVLDPLSGSGEPFRVEREKFESSWAGHVILLKRDAKIWEEDQPFGLKWFIPEILRRRKLFRDVIIAALVMHLIALVIPIFFQIVVDKVLTHSAFSTLKVLTIGVLIAIGFNGIMSFLRTYLLMHATMKIDMRVAARTFRKLLSLPSSFFDRATAGVIAKHMQQGGVVRQFLTGQTFMTMLDATVLIVFLPVLYFYSPTLTAVVLGFTFMMGLIIGVLIPTFRRRLHALYQAEGERQAMLVESVHGAGTIKALALEPERIKEWDAYAADAVHRTFDVGKISAFARASSQTLEQLMMVAVIATGVFLVFDGNLTVGELIAFQMLSGRVSAPLVQAVGLIHQYQEAALSVRMLGEIMNAPSERAAGARGLRPPVEGELVFDNVNFTYPGAVDRAIDGLTLKIDQGMSIGIVGKSGSGKTTLAKLLQGLYPVQSGSIRIDGVDIREIDLGYLRSKIGVVPQESFLFRGTIRDNIRAADTSATFEEVIEAAKLAGADEFIRELPGGYDTMLEENASNLSGGQRQRLAIARALMRKPPIFVLDEATSALDPDSEAIVQANLNRIGAGRTMVIISHRLGMIRDCDAILVMERGKLDDFGKHDELLARNELYHHLWTTQNRDAS